MALPPRQDESGEEVHMDPEVEARLSPMLAQAAQQLLAKNQGEAAQQQAQKQAQDPLVQLQQQEVQIKSAEQQRKVAKDQTDAAIKAAQLQIERDRVAGQNAQADKRDKIDAVKAAAQMNNERQSEMARLSIDVLKHLSTRNQADKQMELSQRQSPSKPKGE